MKFNYKVYNDNNELVFKGSADEVKEKYYITSLSSYTDKGARIMGKYRVEKEPVPFLPKENQEYYYYSLYTGLPIRAFWDSRNGQCISYQRAGNVYKTREQCVRYGKVLMQRLQDEYLEKRLNG